MSKIKKNKKIKNIKIENEDKVNDEKIKEAKGKKHKKFNVKKNLGRLVALIIVLCMLLASSATLIFYLMLDF